MLWLKAPDDQPFRVGTWPVSGYIPPAPHTAGYAGGPGCQGPDRAGQLTVYEAVAKDTTMVRFSAMVETYCPAQPSAPRTFLTIDYHASKGIPAVRLSAPTVGFADHNLTGDDRTERLLVTNRGRGTLTVTAPATTGGYRIVDDGCRAAVAPGGSCHLDIAAPSTDAAGELSFADNTARGHRALPLGRAARAEAPDPLAPSMGEQRIGTVGESQAISVTNDSDNPVRIGGVGLVADPSDPAAFYAETDCRPDQVLAPHSACTIGVVFAPGAARVMRATFVVTDSSPGSPRRYEVVGTGTAGYFAATADGQVFGYGDAAGDTALDRLSFPLVGGAATTSGDGLWLAASDGGIFSLGDAGFFGSTGNLRLNRPIVGMAATPSGGGYRLVASDGGIFSFGDARFFGSTGAIRLNRPIVAMATTPDGQGFWMVADDGGIFAFGAAPFHGSTGGMRLSAPIRAMATGPDGYWLLAEDGSIYSFGQSSFQGSPGAEGLHNFVGLFPTVSPAVLASL